MSFDTLKVAELKQIAEDFAVDVADQKGKRYNCCSCRRRRNLGYISKV